MLYLANMAFQLKTSYFEGPLELLLSLIEDKKLHVSEITLAEVTEDYLNYMGSFSNIPHNDDQYQMFLQDRSQFVAVAATLILIKSRSLLPAMELSAEETESIDDLTERLWLYEIIKRYGELLGRYIDKKPVMYRGNPTREKPQPKFTPHESFTTGLLVQTLQEIFTALPVTESLPEKSVKTTITLAEVMERVERAVQSGAMFSLRDATDKYRAASTPAEKREAKVYAVLSFLAVLEMVKKSIVMVEQNEMFQDINVIKYQQAAE